MRRCTTRSLLASPQLMDVHSPHRQPGSRTRAPGRVRWTLIRRCRSRGPPGDREGDRAAVSRGSPSPWRRRRPDSAFGASWRSARGQRPWPPSPAATPRCGGLPQQLFGVRERLAVELLPLGRQVAPNRPGGRPALVPDRGGDGPGLDDRDLDAERAQLLAQRRRPPPRSRTSRRGTGTCTEWRPGRRSS